LYTLTYLLEADEYEITTTATTIIIIGPATTRILVAAPWNCFIL
jgi:hypothetical protein